MNRLRLTLLAVCVIGCATDAVAPPPWLQALIQQIESEPPASPPLYVARYEYRGQTVYYLPPRCCDVFSDLYDVSGTIICHPDGGLAGQGDGRCSDFLTAATNEQILWRDPRAAAANAGGPRSPD
jgi:hypothetical protein